MRNDLVVAERRDRNRGGRRRVARYVYTVHRRGCRMLTQGRTYQSAPNNSQQPIGYRSCKVCKPYMDDDDA